jgi:phage gpG-like protein
VKLEIEARGVSKTVADIQGIAVRSRSLGPLGRQFAAIVNRSTEARFRSRGGGSWPPLSPDTARQKSGNQMLIDSGALHQAVTHQTAEATADEIRVSPNPDVEYARFLNYGTVNMPARKLVELRPGEQREAAKLVERYVVKGRT